MRQDIPTIHEKIGAIQLGLLRYTHKGKKVSLQVRIAVDESDTLNCIVCDGVSEQRLLNKNITLIQKDHDNYMYIGGRITKEAQTNKLILSVDIKKACWYIRKSKGSVTWLQEKVVYLPQLQAAS